MRVILVSGENFVTRGAIEFVFSQGRGSEIYFVDKKGKQHTEFVRNVKFIEAV